jgi:hypothetical protein
MREPEMPQPEPEESDVLLPFPPPPPGWPDLANVCFFGSWLFCMFFTKLNKTNFLELGHPAPLWILCTQSLKKASNNRIRQCNNTKRLSYFGVEFFQFCSEKSKWLCRIKLIFLIVCRQYQWSF